MKSQSWTNQGGEGVSSDGELVVSFREEGRDAAYGELIQRYQIPVFRLLLGLINDQDSAEESCENVFIRGAKQISDLSEPNNYYPWIVDIAREVAFGPNTQAVTIIANKDDDGPSQPLSPDKELAAAVKRAMGSMSPEQRAVLIFSELQQNSPEEISLVLDKPVDEIRELVSSAREIFLSQLSEDQQKDPLRIEDRMQKNTIIDDRYRIIEVLGEGGMGTVYRAEHKNLGREVALKVLRFSGMEFRDMRERFKREALVLGKINHPNFVDVADFGETEDGTLFLALEFLSGRSLNEEIDKNRLNTNTALRVTRHILRGLNHLHGQGIVHRDIKPDNIILVEEGGDEFFVKILDLGIAALVTSETKPEPKDAHKLTQHGVVLGTPAYIAPEQAAGREIGPEADLYSLTATLYEMLTGHTLYDLRTIPLLLAAQISTPPPTLASKAKGWSPGDELEALVAKGLKKQPEERFATTQEMLTAVEDLLPKPLGGTGRFNPEK